MQPSFINSAVADSLPNHWLNWCRLCAKEDRQHNTNFLNQNEYNLKNENNKLSIQGAIEKYFSIQTSFEDCLPKMICHNCLSLVSSMINFNERVERVQLMFAHLAESQSITNSLDLNTIRLKFDLTDSERNHLFKKFSFRQMPKFSNEVTFSENSRQNADDDVKIQIKLENLEKLIAKNYDESMEENEELEKEEIAFDDNVNDSLPENEEDPFQYSEKKEKYSSDEDEKERQRQSPTLKKQLDIKKLKLDRSKKKRKRKKFKQFSSLDVKTRKRDIKDFKIEATCKECGKIFSKYILYREHMQQRHDQCTSEKHWPCPLCEKVLLSLYNLERHVRIHVPLEARQTIKCPECDNRYISNAQLETHIRYKHKNEKPFICEECGLCLRTNSNLRQHMLTHTDIAPFECEVCKKKFKNKTRLKTHMDIHSPNKHMCNICGLQLNSRATLNRHFLVHSDDMQHKCDYCGKAFKRAKALKNHLLLHTGLKPYSCDFCERTFANGSNCRSHMKKMHPEELAVLEASGNKTHTKNIPKLETLKAVTKVADNLTPVVTKFSGCFAFGKKPKNVNTNDKMKQVQQEKLKKPVSTQNNDEKLNIATPLDLQFIPLAGNMTTSCLPNDKNLENDLSTSTLAVTTTPIPNFHNIYQHLMKQNHIDSHIKQPLSQISPQLMAGNVSTPHHNTFYQDIMNHSIKPSLQPGDGLLHSPESHHSSITSSTHDDQSNTSSIQGTFYGPIRTTLPPDNFM